MASSGIAEMSAVGVSSATKYSMSAYSGNVSVLFPYISDTGTLVPASCVFGQLVNMCAFLGALCVYAWHLHEMYRIEHNECPRLHRTFARITLILGLLCALGFSMVGNFQETSVMIGHLIGAMMTFVSGILFCAVLSFSSRVHLGSPTWLWVLRSILTFINTTCFIFVFVFGALSGEMRLPPRKYEGTEKGYVYHALSVSCEWAQVSVLMIFFLTMVYELRDFTLDSMKVRKRPTVGSADSNTA